MLFLLDTDVICNLEKIRPNPNLVRWLQSVDQDDLAIPLIVIFEIERGIQLLRRTSPARAQQLDDWLTKMISQELYRVIEPNISTDRVRARMSCVPELNSLLMQGPTAKKLQTGGDLAIAAAAIANNAVVVTFNERDFRRIHEHFALPGLFHPGRLEWIVRPGESVVNPPIQFPDRQGYRVRYRSLGLVQGGTDVMQPNYRVESLGSVGGLSAATNGLFKDPSGSSM